MAARGDARLPVASWLVLALSAVSILAFWPPYIARIGSVGELYVHLHTLGVVVWMGLLTVQPVLIRRRRFELHRRLGRASYVLAPYVIVTAALLAHDRFRRMDAATFAEAGHAIYLPTLAIVLFGLCYGLAVVNRRRAVPHSRYMLATALPLIDPIVARLLAFYTPIPDSPVVYPLIGYGLTDLALLTWLWFDRRNRQGRPALLSLFPIFLLGHVGWFTLANSQPWFAFAKWYVGLPLP